MSGEPTARAEDAERAKDDLLRRAAESCAHHTHGDARQESAAVLEYLRLYYRHVAPEDLDSRDPADVWGPAMCHRRLGEDRPPGRAKVHAFTPTLDDQGWDPGHSVVQVVTDDLSFLFVSVFLVFFWCVLSSFLFVL